LLVFMTSSGDGPAGGDEPESEHAASSTIESSPNLRMWQDAPMNRIDLAGLNARIVGPDDAPVTVVLLHGFGAPGEDLVPLSQVISGKARYVFPAAPLELDGYGGGRAWWLLDLARLEAELRSGVPRDRRDEVPAGLHEVRGTMLRLLDQLAARLPARKLVLGGFSQGAMLALDVALHSERAVDGLLLMSGTLVADAEWSPRMGKLAGTPIALSHGRRDAILPYAMAEVLRDKLRAAGATVDWQPFVGGHEIPPPVIDAAGRLLETVLAQ
jgi:phospholipase/carboxylesterase